MLVFCKEKYIMQEGLKEYKMHQGWVDLCHGHRAEKIDGHYHIGEFYISKDWCIEVTEKIKKTEYED